MKVFTNAELLRIHKETLLYEHVDFNLHGFDEVCAYKNQWCENLYFDTDLSLGTKLDIVDKQVHINYNNLVEHDDRAYLTAKFYLSGYHSVICPGIKGIPAEYAETGGQSYLFYLPNIEEIEQYWTGDRLKRLKIEIDVNTIRRFISELNAIPKQLQRLIEEENPQRFHFAVGSIKSQMQTIIQQIGNHPYQGAIAKMYLEGKVLELLAMQLTQLAEADRHLAKSTLKPQSIDRIYQARDILSTRLENPPSISELTQQIGLCDRTLRRGFRELFGTTVVGYLTSLRMEQAEQLLREKELNISEVANLVGYSNLSYFAAAFKRQFGITPSECSMGKLRR